MHAWVAEGGREGGFAGECVLKLGALNGDERKMKVVRDIIAEMKMGEIGRAETQTRWDIS